jgi:methionyl-tRNA synthetase
MIGKYADFKVPEIDKGAVTEEDRLLVDALEKMVADYSKFMDGFQFHRALQSVWEVIGMLNRYIVTNAPWELATQEDKADRLNTVLYFLADSLRLLALVLRPIMPVAAGKMAAALGMDEQLRRATLESDGCWGKMEAGTLLSKGAQLFPRLDKKKKQQSQGKQGQKQKKQQAKKKKQAAPAENMEGMITFDQFGKMELRVAEIIAAEKIKKADKLLKLTLKAPEERTVVAGIAKFYSAEELVGMKVIIVANLKPAKLMGVTSQGMVLAAKEQDADGNERLVLSTVSADIAAGSRVA